MAMSKTPTAPTEEMEKILDLSNQSLKDRKELVLSHLLSPVSESPSDEEVAKAVVMANQVFQYQRFTKESVVDNAAANAFLVEGAEVVWNLANRYPNARKTCWLSLTNKLGEYYLYAERNYARAEAFFQTALNMAHFASDTSFWYDRARALSNLGYLVWNKGHDAVAKNYLNEAKELYQKNTEPYLLEQVFSLNCLALVDKTETHYEEALQKYAEALGILQKIDASETHLHYPMIFHNLGTVYRLLEKYEEAETYLQTAFKINFSAFGSMERMEIPGNLHELGNTYFAMGRYEEAEEMYQQALTLRKAIFNHALHLDLAASYHSLGTVCIKTAREEEGNAYFEKEQEIYTHLNISKEAASKTAKRYCQ